MHRQGKRYGGYVRERSYRMADACVTRHWHSSEWHAQAGHVRADARSRVRGRRIGEMEIALVPGRIARGELRNCGSIPRNNALIKGVHIGHIDDDAAPPSHWAVCLVRLRKDVPNANDVNASLAPPHDAKVQRFIEAYRARYVVRGERDGAQAFDAYGCLRVGSCVGLSSGMMVIRHDWQHRQVQMRALDDRTADMPRFVHGVFFAFEYVVAVGVEMHGLAEFVRVRAVSAYMADIHVTVRAGRRSMFGRFLDSGQHVNLEAFVVEHAPLSGIVRYGRLLWRCV